MATFSTLSSLDEAIVNGAIKGTFKALFSALCTSTVKVAVKFLNPKLVVEVVAAIVLQELGGESLERGWNFCGFWVTCIGEQRMGV